MRILMTIMLVFVLSTVGLVTGCEKAKADKTIRDAQNKAAQTLGYIKNIAKANNDAFVAGDIDSSIHRPVNEGAAKALTATNAFVAAIKAAKVAVANGADAAGQVNALKAFFNSNVASTVLDLTSLLVNVPPALKSKIGVWVTGLQLAISTFNTLFAEMERAVGGNDYGFA